MGLKPLVTVLMPVYNAAATLEEAVASLAGQSLEAFDVVAVDDGSTDDSLALLRAWERRDGRVQVLAAGHAGLVGALNRGLAVCRGELVARMDADDIAHPQRLEKQAALLQREAGLSVAGCLVELFPKEQVGIGFGLYVEWLNGLVGHADIAREMFIESPIVHPSAMVRRAELLEMGGYRDMGWAEDYDLWLRYHAAGRRFGKVPEVLLYWREHEARLTRTDACYSVENFLRAKAHFLVQGPLSGRDGFFVWGAGQTGRRLSKHLIRGGCPPRAFVDIDPKKIGRTMRGVEVIDAAGLMQRWSSWERPLLLAAVGSRGARGLIRQRMAELGLEEGEDFICVA